MKTNLIFIISVLFLLCSCSDWLDTQQKGVTSQDEFYKTDDEALAAVYAVYASLQDGEPFLFKNFMSDDANTGGGARGDNFGYEEINEFRHGSSNGQIKNHFETYYRGIYLCNMAIDRDMRNMESDAEFENRIRPQELDSFRGQDKVAENLRVFIRAALMRGDSLDHVLLHGPPGLGKTTLANIIANEMGSTLRVTSGPVLDKPGDLAGLLTNLNAGDVLFIDEIHRLSPIVEEYLYSAMEDYKIDIVLDKGPSARSIQLELNPFTLIGATTRSGLLTSPLRARFGIQCHLEYYDAPVLAGIVRRSAGILGIAIKDEAAQEIAMRSRGTPRIANSLLRRVRDFAMVMGNGSIDLPITRTALQALDIDSRGLDQMDNKILSTIIHKFGGGPVGLNTIATAVSEDAGTIEEVYEPFLIKEGFLKRTPRGREVTSLAYSHLGVTPLSEEGTLF